MKVVTSFIAAHHRGIANYMKLNIQTVDHLKPRSSNIISKKPGIYSWYFNFSHLKSFIKNRTLLYNEIIATSKTLSYPPLLGTVGGRLGLEYETSLINTDKIKLNATMKKSLKTMSEKEIFEMIELFNAFSSPLYIGIAKSLKTRYEDHLSDIGKARAGNLKKNCFGLRVDQMGIDPRYLIFKYIIFEGVKRYDRLTMEYIANRLFKPLAGEK